MLSSRVFWSLLDFILFLFSDYSLQDIEFSKTPEKLLVTPYSKLVLTIMPFSHV
jgi:hypothetical protein